MRRPLNAPTGPANRVTPRSWHSARSCLVTARAASAVWPPELLAGARGWVGGGMRRRRLARELFQPYSVPAPARRSRAALAAKRQSPAIGSAASERGRAVGGECHVGLVGFVHRRVAVPSATMSCTLIRASARARTTGESRASGAAHGAVGSRLRTNRLASGAFGVRDAGRVADGKANGRGGQFLPRYPCFVPKLAADLCRSTTKPNARRSAVTSNSPVSVRVSLMS